MSKNKNNTFWWIVLAIILFCLIIYLRSPESNEIIEKERELADQRQREKEAEKKLKSLTDKKNDNIKKQDTILSLIEAKKEIKDEADRKFNNAYFVARLLAVLSILLINVLFLLLTTQSREWNFDVLSARLAGFNFVLFGGIGLIVLLFGGSIFSKQKTLELVKEHLRKKNYGKHLLIDDEIKSHEQEFSDLKAEMALLEKEEEFLKGKHSK
jgi:hypothetical protein